MNDTLGFDPSRDTSCKGVRCSRAFEEGKGISMWPEGTQLQVKSRAAKCFDISPIEKEAYVLSP